MRRAERLTTVRRVLSQKALDGLAERGRHTRRRPLTSVFRVDEARGMTRSIATLIDALEVPPATNLARIWDIVATLAVPCTELRTWILTQRGVDRVTAEADGRLETFFDPTSELAPATWSDL